MCSQLHYWSDSTSSRAPVSLWSIHDRHTIELVKWISWSFCMCGKKHKYKNLVGSDVAVVNNAKIVFTIICRLIKRKLLSFLDYARAALILWASRTAELSSYRLKCDLCILIPDTTYAVVSVSKTVGAILSSMPINKQSLSLRLTALCM